MALSRGELDGAVLALEADVGDVAHAVLGRDEFVVALGPEHPLGCDSGDMPLRALVSERVHLLTEGHCLRDQALDLCGSVGPREADFQATSLSTLVQVVLSTKGLTLLPKMAVEIEHRREALAIRRLTEPRPFRTIALTWRHRSAIAESMKTLAETFVEGYPSAD